MKHLTLSKVGLVLLSFLSVVVFSACSSTNVPYRTYYLDGSCKVFYVDSFGNKVYEGGMGSSRFTGVSLMKDSDGRWFYKDSFGNKVFVVKHCMRCR